MTISPCAMLMTPMTPKVMARPMAASSSTEPSDRPYQTFCATSQTARLVLIEAMFCSIAGFRSSGALSRAAVRIVSASRLPRAAIVSMAAFLSSALASVLSRMTARAASMRRLDLGILLLRQRGVQQVEIVGIGILEQVLRGGQARSPIGAQQRQLAECRADRAAQAVVELDLVKITGDIGCRRAGQHIEVGAIRRCRRGKRSRRSCGA